MKTERAKERQIEKKEKNMVTCLKKTDDRLLGGHGTLMQQMTTRPLPAILRNTIAYSLAEVPDRGR